MRKHYTMLEPYTVKQYEEDEYYFLFKFGVPLAHFNSEKTANTVAILLNDEYAQTKIAEDKVKTNTALS